MNFSKRQIIILFFIASNVAYSSPQLPDYLVFEGDTFAVYQLILEQYFEKEKVSDEGSLFGLNFRDGATVNCWRGYQAIYQIEHDSLFLSGIIACRELLQNHEFDIEASKMRMVNIFGKKVINGKVFLDWYSDKFSLPKGDILRWDGVFNTTFEKELLFRIKGGHVTKIQEIANYIDFTDRINRRYNDTLSNVLFSHVIMSKWKNIDKIDCSEEYLVIVGKNGKVRKVAFADPIVKEELEGLQERYEYYYCHRALLKRLKKLRFDIVKVAGKPVEEKVRLELWFNDDGSIENWTF